MYNTPLLKLIQPVGKQGMIPFHTLKVNEKPAFFVKGFIIVSREPFRVQFQATVFGL